MLRVSGYARKLEFMPGCLWSPSDKGSAPPPTLAPLSHPSCMTNDTVMKSERYCALAEWECTRSRGCINFNDLMRAESSERERAPRLPDDKDERREIFFRGDARRGKKTTRPIFNYRSTYSCPPFPTSGLYFSRVVSTLARERAWRFVVYN